MQNKTSIYLSGLNGIRAIAAISVIISHIGLNLNSYQISNVGGYALASFGVTMFFALSGFLITYLLLSEKAKTKTIAIRKFYVRRILRIWPLYYFYLIAVLVIIGYSLNNFSLMYFVLLPNVPFALEASAVFAATLPYLAHYWSVGVEEQFYVFWPWVIKKSKNILLTLTIFVFSFFLFKVFLTLIDAPKFIITFFHYTRFGCLAIGGIAAYLLFNRNERILKFTKNKISEVLAWGIICLIAVNKFHLFSIIDHEIVTIATLIIIINQADNPQKLISLENKVFDYLGKISYGLYIYNPLIIYFVSILLSKVITNGSILNIIAIYVITGVLVVLVSHFSYFYFENWFLKFKDKFAVIKSKSSAS